MQNEREINRERRHPNTAHYYPSVLTIMKIVTQKRTRAHARIHRGYFRYSCDIPLPPSSKRRELKTFERTTGTNKTVRGGNRGLQSVHVREKKLHNLFFDSHTHTQKKKEINLFTPRMRKQTNTGCTHKQRVQIPRSSSSTPTLRSAASPTSLHHSITRPTSLLRGSLADVY